MSPISLLYHDVVNGDVGASGFQSPDADSYKLDERNFRRHLEQLAELGTGRVQVMNGSGHLRGLSGNPILLTFDDGGVSAHEPTARLLEERGWRGHFFVVTSKVDAFGFLTREQIRDLHRRGHHIGSHSHTHPPRFSHLSYDRMLHEWRESRRLLTDILDDEPYSVSVPGGFYSAEVARAAHEAGYTVLFNSEPTSTIRQAEGLLVVGRYGIKSNTTAESARALARGDRLPRARQALLWNAKKPLKKAGGRIWFSARRWFFEARRQTVDRRMPLT